MLRRFATYLRRHHLALLALFVALGGTSVAATNALLPRNSVGTAQLRNGAVTKKKIAKKTIAGLKGNRGARGLPGAAGATGPKGPTGAPGPTQFARVSSTGHLVSGTASGASRISAGDYEVTFPSVVNTCAGAAGPAAFSGVDATKTLLRAWAVVDIGDLTASTPDPHKVAVLLYDQSAGPTDTNFTLSLTCP